MASTIKHGRIIIYASFKRTNRIILHFGRSPHKMSPPMAICINFRLTEWASRRKHNRNRENSSVLDYIKTCGNKIRDFSANKYDLANLLNSESQFCPTIFLAWNYLQNENYIFQESKISFLMNIFFRCGVV